MIDYNNNDDADLWKYVTKTTKKIHSKNNSPFYKNNSINKKKQVDIESKNKSQNNNQANTKTLHISPIYFSNENSASGLSKKNIKDIRKGNFKVESKLDLHGYKLREAEILFFEFLQNSFNSKKRNILVISGKGESGKGKIKVSIPFWITSPRISSLIYFYSFAAPKDGGHGAYYIRLRKNEIVR